MYNCVHTVYSSRKLDTQPIAHSALNSGWHVAASLSSVLLSQRPAASVRKTAATKHTVARSRVIDVSIVSCHRSKSDL